MERRLPLLFAAAALVLAAPALAQESAAVQGAAAGAVVAAGPDTAAVSYDQGVARFGPFLVIDQRRAALTGETGAAAPAQFAAMLRAYPRLAQLDMVECPGTQDDQANMALGRAIRAAGLMTWVPRGGSVRSGAVELFFAGTVRAMADTAEFAVHSWRDELGREALDFAADAPEHRKYLDYYREMGMDAGQARAFYAMTNSVSFENALWLTAGEMRRWSERPMAVALAPVSLDGRAPLP